MHICIRMHMWLQLLCFLCSAAMNEYNKNAHSEDTLKNHSEGSIVAIF